MGQQQALLAVFIIVAFQLLLATARKSVEASQESKADRLGKFFSLFTIVRFSNDVCNGTSTNSGYCTSSADCAKINGVAGGKCASGFGVCCEAQYTCGGKSSSRVSYFQNTGFPSQMNATQLGCSFTLTNSDPDLCQLRLDFEVFEMDPPDITTGQCSVGRDMFTVFGDGVATTGIPALCGTNTGQHLYLHMDPARIPVQFQMIAMTNGNNVGRWRVKTTLIDCKENSQLLAPSNCQQYYTDASGTIQTFGYTAAPSTGTRSSPLYPTNMQYAICIKRSYSTGCIKYQFDEFSLGETCNQPSPLRGDFIVLPNTYGVEPFLCGQDANNTLEIGNDAVSWPYTVYFNSDEDGVTPAMQYGFSMKYQTYSDKTCLNAIQSMSTLMQG